MKLLLTKLFGQLVGLYGVALRLTCRFRVHNDTRAAVVSQGYRYVFGTCHAFQIAGVVSAEKGTGAMVSRSMDGEMVVPLLKRCGHIPIRGSSGTGKKAGGPALKSLIQHVIQGRPAMLAMDGPRGPRGSVQRGIAMLGVKTNAAVFLALGIPSRRMTLRKTWDRFQIPMLFCRIDLYLSEPLICQAGESLEGFQRRIEACWWEMEERHDPQEAKYIFKGQEASSRAAA
jgi:lysophospholipid acyltransferase (LPLAT)-like uncharacterized protein